MKLNGWQRLWVVFTVPWLAFVAYRLFSWVVVFEFSLDVEDWSLISLAVIAPFGVYFVVIVVRRLARWIVDGFRGT